MYYKSVDAPIWDNARLFKQIDLLNINSEYTMSTNNPRIRYSISQSEFLVSQSLKNKYQENVTKYFLVKWYIHWSILQIFPSKGFLFVAFYEVWKVFHMKKAWKSKAIYTQYSHNSGLLYTSAEVICTSLIWKWNNWKHII